jgi:hypothetical protein
MLYSRHTHTYHGYLSYNASSVLHTTRDPALRLCVINGDVADHPQRLVAAFVVIGQAVSQRLCQSPF